MTKHRNYFLYSMRGNLLCICVILLFSFNCRAQEGVTAFGFSYKPIFPSTYFRTGPKTFQDKGVASTINQRSGFTAGGLIRRGFSNRISVETGILYSKRNYELKIDADTFVGNDQFKIIGYEIPLNTLVFIQLGEKLWMNAALGGSVDLFPSDIYTLGENYRQYSARNHTANIGVNAMTGIEYRTKKDDYIYFGIAYHRSVSSIYTTLVEYYPGNNTTVPPYSVARTTLQGDYFTFDIRYYFHEDAVKKGKRKNN